MKTAVGSLRSPFPGKHARRVLGAALEGKDAGRIGKLARHIFLQPPAQNIAPGLKTRQDAILDTEEWESVSVCVSTVISRPRTW